MRWIALVPGAALCAFAALFPLHWLVLLIGKLGTSDDDSGSGTPFSLYYYLAKLEPEVLEYAGAAFLTPFVVLVSGARIAPKYKSQAAIGLAIALGVLYGFTYSIVAKEIADGIYNAERYVRLAVTVLLQVGGVTIGLLAAHRHAIAIEPNQPRGDA